MPVDAFAEFVGEKSQHFGFDLLGGAEAFFEETIVNGMEFDGLFS